MRLTLFYLILKAYWQSWQYWLKKDKNNLVSQNFMMTLLCRNPFWVLAPILSVSMNVPACVISLVELDLCFMVKCHDGHQPVLSLTECSQGSIYHHGCFGNWNLISKNLKKNSFLYLLIILNKFSKTDKLK